jgi:putative acetyltransferase
MMEIRQERPGDTDAVADVHRDAFGAAGDTIAALVEELRALQRDFGGLSLVAEHDGQVVANVMFSRGLLDAPAQLVDVQILSPLAVRPTQQRQGIGTALVRAGLEAVGATGAPAVFVEGDPDYYRRFGFVPAGALGFRKPSLRIPDAAFQVFTLGAYEPWMTGTLVYPQAFWHHDAVGLRQPPDAAGQGQEHAVRGWPEW